MAGRASYSEEDKARVFVLLSANEGIVKRTAREANLPESTIRRWKEDWQKQGPPDLNLVEEARGDFVEDASRVRNKALLAIEALIDGGKAKVGELNTTVGILTDKIDRARGLATQRVEHQHTLPSPDEVRALLSGYVAQMVEGSVLREAEIEEAEIVEQAALPSGK